MKKPWTVEEANILLGVLRPKSVEFGFSAGLGPEGIDTKDPTTLTTYFKPINTDDPTLNDKTCSLMVWLSDIWGRPVEKLKEEFNPFPEGRRDGPPVPGRRVPAQRVVNRVAPAANPFREYVIAPGGGGGGLNAVVGGFQDNRPILREDAANAQRYEEDEAPPNGGAALPQYDARGNLIGWANLPAEAPPKPKKPTYRFKYVFVRPDGGAIFTIVH